MAGDRYAKVLDELGAAIVRGEFAPGFVLRVEELQDRYEVSRTVAREVVRALEAMRLTTSKRRVGVTVRKTAEWNHYDPRVIRWQLDGAGRDGILGNLMELRAAIEPSAARLAALRSGTEDRGDIRALATRLQVSAKARDLTAFLEHDIAFHSRILAAARNPMFAQLSEVIAEVLTGRTEHGLMPEEPHPDAIAMHLEVADAIDTGDAACAENAMRGIVVQARDEVSATD
ncbi:FadR/GntR family transcriptional regulator [Sciscionella marina]|uniref:FadR/GntR family transcriptional regulator n=1 Tax=Sciscionella marina TaxID=508770 RepID=UPI00035EA373|nr:FCD domain-containing protein [Sciscionella marina]